MDIENYVFDIKLNLQNFELFQQPPSREIYFVKLNFLFKFNFQQRKLYELVRLNYVLL